MIRGQKMTKIENFGFKLIRTDAVEEINATLYEMEHVKSGAQLIYIEREDENKTFSVGFPTLPKNDTGVFHIIEHSVLCGSKKYPLRDPFAELLKGSLNTFLNAMTYEDRTVYPVSSRCEKDFLNLVDVYLDAVFSPNLVENPSIFMQEGWHYEYDEETKTLSYNGVVYNEMKGAYSSPDELGIMALNRALFAGTPYGKDSGGEPSYIPSLSYEEFVETYKENYHPSRAKIILDGQMSLDRVLPIIDEHISAFEKRSFTLPEYKKAEPVAETEIKYEISESEDEHGKARVLYGYVCTDIFDKTSSLAITVLTDILCGSNAAPLKRALIDRGLAKDAAMYPLKAREVTLVIEIRDADETRLDEIDATVKEIVGKLIADGIEKEKLNATLNSIEFRLRERDFGTLPSGIAFAMAIYGAWMYGAKPESALTTEEIFDLRKLVDEDYFEKKLKETIIDNKRVSKVIMLPDKTLSARNAEEERICLKNLLDSMTEEEIAAVIENQAALEEWQQSEISEEEMASLPTLTLADIPTRVNRPGVTESEVDGVKILRCPVKTNEIVYLSLHLDASDLSERELVQLSTLSAMLINAPTELRDALSLQNDIKANLGSFFTAFTIGNRDGIAKPYFKLSASALCSKQNDLLRIIREVLLTSKVDDETEILNILSQMTSQMEEAMVASGEAFAMARVEASITEIGAITEHLSGYEAYKTMKEILSDKAKLSELAKSIDSLLKRLNDRSRLMIIITGEASDGFISELVGIFDKKTDKITKKPTPLCAEKSEFAIVPSKVAYAVLGGRSDSVGENLGFFRVARSILSYEYLWNNIRVKNGAYGAGFTARQDGEISFYSYRDPNPHKSVECYRESSAYLRAIADADIDITKFVIGAIGEYDFIITPKTAHTIASRDYLGGYTEADEIRNRERMLNMTAKDLITVADLIDEALSDASIAVVGGSEHLELFKEKPSRIIKI